MFFFAIQGGGGSLTSNLIFFGEVMKVLYIYICKAVFDFKHRGLNLICKGMWVVRARTVLFAERGVLGSQRPGDFLLASVFCWNF